MSDRHNKRSHGDGSCRKDKKNSDSKTDSDTLTSSGSIKKRRTDNSSSSSNESAGESVRIDPNVIELSDSDSSVSSIQFISSDSPGSDGPSNDEYTFGYNDSEAEEDNIRLGIEVERSICRDRFGFVLQDLPGHNISVRIGNFTHLYCYGGLERGNRMPANQQSMWRSQQADAENRRRRATTTMATTSATSSTVVPSVNLPQNTATTNSAASATTSTATTTSGTSTEDVAQMVRQAAFRAFVRSPESRDVEEQQRFANLLMFHQNVLPYLIQDQPVQNGPLRLGDRITMTVINSLTTEYQYSSVSGLENKDCAICMETYADGQQLRSLPCLHSFHKACVDRWLCEQFKCPICRYNVVEPIGEGRTNTETADEAQSNPPQETDQ